VLSPSTEDFDRNTKMLLYAENGVRWAWLVDPLARTLEVYLLEGGRWNDPTVSRGDARVRAVPFDAIELKLASLWAPRAGKTLPRKAT